MLQVSALHSLGRFASLSQDIAMQLQAVLAALLGQHTAQQPDCAPSESCPTEEALLVEALNLTVGAFQNYPALQDGLLSLVADLIISEGMSKLYPFTLIQMNNLLPHAAQKFKEHMRDHSLLHPFIDPST